VSVPDALIVLLSPAKRAMWKHTLLRRWRAKLTAMYSRLQAGEGEGGETGGETGGEGGEGEREGEGEGEGEGEEGEGEAKAAVEDALGACEALFGSAQAGAQKEIAFFERRAADPEWEEEEEEAVDGLDGGVGADWESNPRPSPSLRERERRGERDGEGLSPSPSPAQQAERALRRIVWVTPLPYEQYLSMLALGDAMLDPFPFGGGVTVLEVMLY
jgi:hypothetical protein